MTADEVERRRPVGRQIVTRRRTEGEARLAGGHDHGRRRRDHQQVLAGPATRQQPVAVDPGEEAVREVLGRPAGGVHPGQLGEVLGIHQGPAVPLAVIEPQLPQLSEAAGAQA